MSVYPKHLSRTWMTAKFGSKRNGSTHNCVDSSVDRYYERQPMFVSTVSSLLFIIELL